MNQHEIEVMVEAGMSREQAQMVCASYTMASALATIHQQQNQPTELPEEAAAIVIDSEEEGGTP